MADRYIDFFEVEEYGQHFISVGQSLVGVSSLVDMGEVIRRVEAAKKQVATELDRAGVRRSGVRSGSGDLDQASAAGRSVVEKFWSFLGSLDDDVRIELNAFFPGGKQGVLNDLKPADLRAKIEQVLRGFSVPAHAELPDAKKWTTRLGDAAAALNAALGDQGMSRGGAKTQTAALQNAREQFLEAYNGIAKPLVRGLLTALGRRQEFDSFFKDLQVSEDGAGEGKTPEDTGGDDRGAPSKGDPSA